MVQQTGFIIFKQNITFCEIRPIESACGEHFNFALTDVVMPNCSLESLWGSLFQHDTCHYAKSHLIQSPSLLLWPLEL